MSAKDMCMVSKIKELIKSGVSSFKIEGRMKTEHYIATVVNAYRKVIDNIYSNKNSDIYVHDIKNAANRETDLAWFNGKPGINKMLYHEVLKQVKQNYAFLIKEKINDTTYKILTKNKIRLSDKYEILSPNLDEIPTIKIIKILDSENNSVDFISAPMSYCIITFNKKINLKENDIGRIN
jgi:putative protease